MNEGGARPVNRQGGVEGEVTQVPMCEIRDTGISIIHAKHACWSFVDTLKIVIILDVSVNLNLMNILTFKSINSI